MVHVKGYTKHVRGKSVHVKSYNRAARVPKGLGYLFKSKKRKPRRASGTRHIRRLFREPRRGRPRKRRESGYDIH